VEKRTEILPFPLEESLLWQENLRRSPKVLKKKFLKKYVVQKYVLPVE